MNGELINEIKGDLSSTFVIFSSSFILKRFKLSELKFFFFLSNRIKLVSKLRSFLSIKGLDMRAIQIIWKKIIYA